MSKWQCMVCGFVHDGSSPPGECPTCGSPWAAFQKLADAEPVLPQIVADRPSSHKYVIIGNSSAGRSAAQAIHKLHSDANITIVTEETAPFYYRPILPDYIGGMSESRVFRAAKGAYYDDGLNIAGGEIVCSINTEAGTVTCASGLDIEYDSLLIASGSTPVTVAWPGSDVEGIACFRTFADAQRIAAAVEVAERAVVVGGGLLGLEFVRAFLARGLKVTMLVRDDRIGAPGLDVEAGEIIERRLRDLGVEVALQEEVASFHASFARVESVRTSRERIIPCEIVGVAIGVRPRTDCLANANIKTDRGILVDDRFATDARGVFAAGDVAQAFDAAYGLPRVNTSWRVAAEQGQIAGYNMAGADVRSAGTLGSNFQVFGGVAFASIGLASPQDPSSVTIEKDYDLHSSTYRKLVYRDGRLVGAVLVGDTSQSAEIESEIRGDKRPTISTTQSKGTQSMRAMTEQNLKAAFAGESQAHVKYLNFSDKAKTENKPNVARLFAAASYAEQVHASAHLKKGLKAVGSTSENLEAAIGGEGFEVEEMYPAYISVAEIQGENAARTSFFRAIEAEKVHKSLYMKAKDAVDGGQDAAIGDVWVCGNCGYTAEGAQPDECPLCGGGPEVFAKF